MDNERSMRTLLPILTLAAALTALNAVKPLHIDDATFYFNAAQIAAHPLDPYGYVMMRFDEPVPALHALAPPGLPYWWAAGIRLFGARPLLWKLWLFPFALLFVASLSGLLRRFAPAAAMPLLILLVFSPVFLPSLNLMMDIPALALSLTALVLFFQACDRDCAGRAVVAGLTAGLAMQTKYTAFLTPAILLAYALLHRKIRLGLLSAGVAILVFVAWELALVLRYGESHFFYQITQGDNSDAPKLHILGGLCPILGCVMPTLALMALTVLRMPRWMLFLDTLLVGFPYLLLIWEPVGVLEVGSQELSLTDILFGCNGAMVLLATGLAAWRLLRRSPGRTVWFLVLWLALELAGYVAISPFPAVRRVMGVTIAVTLLLGCLASQSPLEPWRRNALRGLSAATALLGLGFYGIDYLEARAEQQAAYEAARRIREQEPDAVIWYAGYWGFQFYAEQVGMKQIVPRPQNGEPVGLPPSRFRRGDWLVIPSTNIPQQTVDLDGRELEAKDEVAIADAVPLSTIMGYYAGSFPLRHHSGPRIVVRLFRVEDDFIPRSSP
jgi:hypothetical protein